jgi:hypothetical protein
VPRRVLEGPSTPQSIPATQPPPSTQAEGVRTQNPAETIASLIETIQNALSAVESSHGNPTNHRVEFATIRDALEKIQQTTPAATPPAPEGLEALLSELKGIKKDVQDTKRSVAELPRASFTSPGSGASSTRTWASVASMPYSMGPPTSIGSTPPIPSVTVKVTDPELNAEFKALTPPELLKNLKERGLAEAIAAKTLPSGDLKVTLANPADKKRLEETREWDQRFQGRAKTVTQIHAVEVMSVRINELGKTPEELKVAIPGLLAENKHIPGLRIDSIHWMRRIKPDSTKTHASLILRLPQLGLSDTLRARGMVIGSVIHEVRPHDSKCRVTQCFKCQRFGHTTRACSSPPRCGHCAGDHDTRDHGTGECPNESQVKCANCGQRHKAWDRTCRLYKEKLEQARTHRLLLPHERSPGGTIIEPYPIPPITGKRPTVPQEEPVRRRPGRPRKIDQANPPTQPRLSFSQPATEPSTAPLVDITMAASQ